MPDFDQLTKFEEARLCRGEELKKIAYDEFVELGKPGDIADKQIFKDIIAGLDHLVKLPSSQIDYSIRLLSKNSLRIATNIYDDNRCLVIEIERTASDVFRDYNETKGCHDVYGGFICTSDRKVVLGNPARPALRLDATKELEAPIAERIFQHLYRLAAKKRMIALPEHNSANQLLHDAVARGIQPANTAPAPSAMGST